MRLSKNKRTVTGMAEYIEREELMKFPIRRNHYDKEHGNEAFIYGIETVLEYAENLPAADVAPVRHGRWVHEKTEDGSDIWKCSRCGAGANYNPEGIVLHCFHCGAKMDEVSE